MKKYKKGKKYIHDKRNKTKYQCILYIEKKTKQKEK